MKTLTWFLTFSILVLAPFSMAQSISPDEDAIDMQIQESAVEDIEVKTVNGEELIVTKKGKTFKLDTTKITEETLVGYNTLKDQQKESFQKTRKGILTKLAAVLNTQKVTVGFGIAVKNSVVAIVRKEKKERVPYSSLGQKFIEGVLDSVNTKLWKEAPKIADAKRISFILAPVVQIEGSAPIKLGGAAGITLAFGWDKQKEAMFFDLQTNTERFKSGFLFTAGFRLNFGLVFDSAETISRVRQSELFLPPVVPVWEATGKDFYAFGMNAGLALPPAPFSNAYTYRNLTTQVSLNSIFVQFWERVRGLFAGNKCEHVL